MERLSSKPLFSTSGGGGSSGGGEPTPPPSPAKEETAGDAFGGYLERRNRAGGGGEGGAEAAVEKSAASAPTVQALTGGSLLHLELLLLLGGRVLDAYCLLLLALAPLKGAWLRYPDGWQATEFAFWVLLLVFQRAQRGLGSHGNRAQNSPYLAAFLALCAPLALLVGYFASLQVYVLHLEHFLGLLALALLAGQLALGSGVGIACAASARERGTVCAGAVVALAALVVVFVFAFSSNVSRASGQLAFIAGIVLTSVSALICLGAIALLIVSTSF